MKKLNVLIIGAAGGLGSELARLFAEHGADLLLVDKSLPKLDALSDRIVEAGNSEPGVCKLDLATAVGEQYENLAEILVSEYGGLDVFIHCAAEFDGLRPIDQIDPEYWNKCMQVNASSAWQAVSVLSPLLRGGTGGRVVLIHEDEKISRSAYWGAYGVSKASLWSIGNILNEEFQGSGVEVLNVSPGPMRTSLRASAYLSEDPNTVRHPADAAAELFEIVRKSYAD